MPANTILIVEDDGILCLNMEDMLTAEGYEVMGVLPSGETALELVKERQPDLIIMDINLAGELDGISTVEQIKTIADIPVIYLTAYAENTLIRRARETAPYAFLVKPVQERELIATIEMALHRHSLETKLRETEKALRQSEEKYRQLVENSHDIFFIITEQGEFTYISPNCEVFLGFCAAEIIGKNITYFTHPDDLNMVFQTVQKIISENKNTSEPMSHQLTAEYRAIHKKGSWRWLSAKSTIFKKTDKGFEIAGIARDITERKQAEEDLQVSSEKHQTIIQTSMDGFWLVNTSGQILDVNAAYCKMIGYSREELLGMSIAEIEASENPEEVAHHMEKVLQEGSDRFETLHRCKNGQLINLEVSVYYLPARGGEIYAFLRDITERKKTEDALKQSEYKFRSFVEHSRDIVFMLTEDGVLEYVSPNWKNILGHEPADVVGKTPADFVAEDDVRLCFDYLTRTLGGEDVTKSVEYRVIHKDGSTKWHATRGSVIQADNERKKFIGIARDITDRKQMEQVMHKSRNLLHSVFHSIQDGISVLGTDLTIKEVNKTMERWYDHSMPLSGKKCYEVYQNRTEPCIPCPSVDALKNKMVCSQLVPLMGTKEPVGWLELYSYPLFDNTGNVDGVVEFVRNVTDRKQAEEILHRREEEFRALAENAPDIVLRLDRNLRHLYVNPAIEKETGKCREHFLGKIYEEMGLTSESIKLRKAIMQEVFQTGQEKTHYFEYTTPEGRKYYHSRIVPEFAPDGTVETVLAVIRNITAVKEMEAALYQERAKARQLLQLSLPDDLPALPGLALATSYQPASTLQGDYYNVIHRGDRLLFYLVDAGGDRENDIMHSLYVRNTIDSYLSVREDWTDLSPAQLLQYLVDQHCRDNQAETSPICILIGVINLSHTQEGNTGNSGDTGELRYAARGFCTPPLLISNSKTIELSINGTGEDTNRAANYVEHMVPFAPGSTFIFRTGGPFRLDSESSEPRFRELCARHSHLPSELISSAIDEEINSLNSVSPTHDYDFAALVIQVPEQEQRLSFTVESDFKHISEAKEKTSSFLNTYLKLESDLIDYHELLVNAIEHGNKHDGGKKVSVDISITERYYRITITDQGEGFNWRERINKELDWESESERGRGIIMTRIMTDYLGYNERGNRVTMINFLEQC